jgi:hypothetical protein
MPCDWNTDPGGSSTICATAIPLPARNAPRAEAINSFLIFFSLSIFWFRAIHRRYVIYVASHETLRCKILMFYFLITPAGNGGALASLAAKVSHWRKRLEQAKLGAK